MEAASHVYAEAENVGGKLAHHEVEIAERESKLL